MSLCLSVRTRPNLCKSVKSVDKCSGPSYLALVLMTCAKAHKRACSDLGNVKAELLNFKHDDPAVMDLINRIMVMPLGHELLAAAEQLYTLTVKG